MAQFDAFLKLDGIKGESQDSKHKGEIDILSFRWDTAQTGSHATGGGGGTGKVQFSAIHFVKRADASSPILLLNCACALFDAFLKIEGIKGESADATHKGEIDVLSFRWAAEQSVSAEKTYLQHGHTTGSGGGVGKVKFFDFQITKKTDSASALLLKACVAGQHIKSMNFVVRKAGGTQLEYLKVNLTDVLVSRFKPIAAHFTPPDLAETDRFLPPGDEIPEEDVAFNFAKVEFQYQPQDDRGQAQGGRVIMGWDLKQNVKT